MDRQTIWNIVGIVFMGIAVVMIGMAVFGDVTFSSHTWTKMGVVLFLASTGGYWFLKNRN